MYVIIKSYLFLLLAFTYGAAADDASPASRHVRQQQPRGMHRHSLELQEPSRRALKSKADKKGKDPFVNVPSSDECLVVKKTYTLEAPKDVEFKGPSVYRFEGCGENPTTVEFLKCITKPILNVNNPCSVYYQSGPLLTSDEVGAYKKCLQSYPTASAYSTQFNQCEMNFPAPDLNALNAYRSCIEKKGYPINGKWWFNRDQQGSSFRFSTVTGGVTTKDAVCAKIDSPDTNDLPTVNVGLQSGNLGLGKTKLELWDLSYLKRSANEFVEFKVDYDILSLGTASGAGTVAFVNVYLLKDATSTAFYDCRLDFNVPTPYDINMWKTLTITPITTTTSFAKCGGQNSIAGFLTANPGAVFGVGNGEYYAFTLDTGGTLEDNSNLDVCWSAPTISFKTDVSVHNFVPNMVV